MSVYFIQRGDAGPIKIGHSGNPKARLAALKTASDQPLRLLGIMPGDQLTERQLHSQYADTRLEGEWFSPSDELLEMAHSFAMLEESAPADIRPDWEIGFERLQERYLGDPEGLIKYLKDNLPTSAFNRIVETAADKLKGDAVRGLMASVERL